MHQDKRGQCLYAETLFNLYFSGLVMKSVVLSKAEKPVKSVASIGGVASLAVQDTVKAISPV